MNTIDRSALARALAKATAYADCGQQTKAEEWARELVRLLHCEHILHGPTLDVRGAQGDLAAILHQLTLGEASEGDIHDIQWCANATRSALARLGVNVPEPVRGLARVRIDVERYKSPAWLAMDRAEDRCAGGGK